METYTLKQVLAWLRHAKASGHTIDDLIQMMEFNYHEIPSESLADQFAQVVHTET